MSASRPSRSTGKSIFFQDLATPVSSSTHRGGGRDRFVTPGQAAAVSALWRENFGGTDPPPPPMFTLEDRVDFSPESGVVLNYPTPSSDKTPKDTPNNLVTPLKSGGGNNKGQLFLQSGGGRENWWSPGGRSEEDKGKGVVDSGGGVVNSGALITLPPVREVVRPDVQRSNLPVGGGNLDEEEWVTVYGFAPGDTNLVLREFEKCGTILKHVPGPGNANWMHILYQVLVHLRLGVHGWKGTEEFLKTQDKAYGPHLAQSRFDAHKALSKSGMQINGVLIVGVKPLDPIQRQALSEGPINQGFMPLPPSSTRGTELFSSKGSPRPYYLQNNGQPTQRPSGVIASPAKSYVSRFMDVMFGI